MLVTTVHSVVRNQSKEKLLVSGTVVLVEKPLQVVLTPSQPLLLPLQDQPLDV